MRTATQPSATAAAQARICPEKPNPAQAAIAPAASPKLTASRYAVVRKSSRASTSAAAMNQAIVGEIVINEDSLIPLREEEKDLPGTFNLIQSITRRSAPPAKPRPKLRVKLQANLSGPRARRAQKNLPGQSARRGFFQSAGAPESFISSDRKRDGARCRRPYRG